MPPVQFLQDNRYRFIVWAPEKERMILHVVAPFEKEFPMQKDDSGNFWVEITLSEKDLRYFYKPEGEKDYPDPASQFQPEGVHGPSQIVDHRVYQWKDKHWEGLPLEELVMYELHVGTFTRDGNFEAVIQRLDSLKETGINALELMPVSQFPGNRNWGYDGVYPYAVHASYGGPEGLKKLVDACHVRGIAVFIDGVYNHLGPEGNYLPQFGPYCTKKYRTPWGEAINFDGEWSDGVRDYFSDNIIHWFENYHIDGIRCDAIHTVFDTSAVHFWELVHNKVTRAQKRLGRRFHLIAESDLNSPKVVRPNEVGGYGFDAQWLDDFHHALYVLLNPADKDRYYDFGAIEQLAKGYTEGFVHSGEWVKFRKRRHGSSSAGVPGNKFIAFNLNHDQAGNRAGGERLCMLVNFERVKLAAAALMLSPYIPMLFMGEEYADDTPFFYFVSHGDEELIKAVREGRKAEFKDFGFNTEVPDPQDEDTFNRSKIHWEKRNGHSHNIILQWHQELIMMRKTLAPLQNFNKRDVQVQIIESNAFILFRNSTRQEKLVCFFNLSESEIAVTVPESIFPANKILDSKEDKWISRNEDRRGVHSPTLHPAQTITLLPLSVVVYHSL
jgi:maltooligosyltrehalose trehalohydrolase